MYICIYVYVYVYVYMYFVCSPNLVCVVQSNTSDSIKRILDERLVRIIYQYVTKSFPIGNIGAALDVILLWKTDTLSVFDVKNLYFF